MIPHSSREFLVNITGYWKLFFNSRFLIVTNTVSCGGMLAAGNIIQQTRKKWRVPERACDWAHTGKFQDQGYRIWIQKDFPSFKHPKEHCASDNIEMEGVSDHCKSTKTWPSL
uniref:Uncharacterized protein n=1 Tax=Oncorhynchus kisutch TaxID=8019 RepID=A0A8C7M8Z6_ONCKI